MTPKRTEAELRSDRNRKFSYELTHWLPLEKIVPLLEPFFSNEQVVEKDYCIRLKREKQDSLYCICTTGEFIGSEECVSAPSSDEVKED